MQGNLELNKKERSVSISVNPKIYPVDVILSSAYMFTEDYYIFLDGDVNEEIIVEMRPKNKTENLEQIGKEFNNELINYASYAIQSIKNTNIRGAIINRVLSTHNPQSSNPHQQHTQTSQENKFCDCNENVSSQFNSLENDTESWKFDDPDGIAVSWEEK